VRGIGQRMILMGDEARRTQRADNNAYCLDDDTSWFDWLLHRVRPSL
jgi:isoamylase